MLFNTLPFAVFFALFFGVWSLLPARSPSRRLLLALASLAFYAAWDARYLLLLGAVASANWALARGLFAARDARWRLGLMATAVALDLGTLGFWKYTDFALDTLRPAATALHVVLPPPLHLVLPVGISFFTFQALGYVIDVYRKAQPAVRRCRDVFLALAFFPHLVAGPLVRVWDLLPRLYAPEALDNERFGRSLVQLMRGLLKKAAADFLAQHLVDRVFDLPSHYSTLEVAAAIYGYALQIYGDFSGYSDMALGLAGLLGIDLPQNFDRPYAARSLREFWRRWHITLSTWLRDYLFISLGGSRGGPWHTARNLLITMILGGLWHGAAWTFIAWGALHGLGLVIERALPSGAEGGRGAAVVRTLLTFHLVCLAWVFFRAESVAGAIELLGQLGRGWGGGAANLTLEAAAVLVIGLGFQWVPRRWVTAAEGWLVFAPSTVQAAAALACVYLTRSLCAGSVQPFIYFQF